MNARGREAEASFQVVFEGELQVGADPESIRKSFTDRFGESNCRTAFTGRRVVLKSGLTEEQARRFQQQLELMGMMTSLVPAPITGSTGHTSQKAYTVAELDAAFKGDVAIPPMSRHYLLALLPVTLAMLMMPLIYLGITAASGYGVFWFATTYFGWAYDPDSTSWAWNYLRLMAFCAVVLGGALITVFLIRPFLSPGIRGPEPVHLQRDRERAIFHLVERIATSVGAPVPHEIFVDTAANASARLMHGIFSRRLTLTIGLPLLYGMNVHTVAGILAHEFGHFSQRFGMRSFYIVQTLNLWFHRRAVERDGWDEFVEELRRSDHPASQIASWIAGAGRALCRRLLRMLASIARLLSLALLRQMELDADRYEIALTGSAQYRRTAEALCILGAGHYLAVQDLVGALDKGKLADNLPRLASVKADALSDTERKRIVAGIQRVNSSVHDTHPPDRVRIERAIEMNIAPRLVHDGPATRLLSDIERSSRLATLQWYRSHGLQVSPDDLQPVAGIEADSNTRARARKVHEDYLGPLADLPQRPRLMPQIKLNEFSENELVKSLSNRLTEIRQREREFAKALRDLRQQRDYRYWYSQALLLRRAGVAVDSRVFPIKLTLTDTDAIERKLAVHREAETKLRTQLVACVELQGQRLSFALELASRRGIVQRAVLEKLRRTYAAISAVDKEVEPLSESNARLDFLMQAAVANGDDNKRARDAIGEAEKNARLQTGLREAFRTIPDPGTAGTTLADALPELPPGRDERNASTVLGHAASMLRLFTQAAIATEGQLAEVARAAESGLAGDATAGARASER